MEIKRQSFEGGGHGRNRTGVHGFAVRCVTTPPRGQYWEGVGCPSLYRSERSATISGKTCLFGPIPAQDMTFRVF